MTYLAKYDFPVNFCLKNPVNQSQPNLTLQEYQQQVQTPDLFYPLYKGCFIGTIIPCTFIKLHS